MPVAMAGRSESSSRLHDELPAEVLQLPYFHADVLNSDQASERLRSHGQGSGSFLLRPSAKGNTRLSISVIIPHGGVRHVNITISNKCGERCYYIVPEVQFATIADLQNHYKEHRICNMEQIDNIRLQYAVSRPPHSRSTSVGCIDTGRGKAGEWYLGPHDSEAGGRGSGGLPQAQKSGCQPAVLRHGSSTSSMISHQNSLPESGWRNPLDRGSPRELSAGFATMHISPSGRDIPETHAREDVFQSPRQTEMRGRFFPDSFDLDSQGLSDQRSSGNSTDSASGAAASAPARPVMPPPLPTFPNQDGKKEIKKGGDAKPEKKDKKKDKKKKFERPPMPLPMPIYKQSGENPYYTHPRDCNENRLPELKRALIENDRCECGLRLVDAELPRGWTLHRVREPSMLNRPFFQNAQGRTQWTLPEELAPLLSERQRSFVIEQFSRASLPPPECLFGVTGSSENASTALLF